MRMWQQNLEVVTGYLHSGGMDDDDGDGDDDHSFNKLS